MGRFKHLEKDDRCKWLPKFIGKSSFATSGFKSWLRPCATVLFGLCVLFAVVPTGMPIWIYSVSAPPFSVFLHGSDIGLDKMNEQSFDATEATLILMTIAYNFMSLFKQLVIGGKVRNSLSTLRYKIPATLATIENCGDKIIVNMAIQINRRAWIRKL